MKSKKPRGICILAGAGPGDPGLVTLRTRECLELADVVICDHLVNPEILQWTRPGTEIVYAGKKAGVATIPQEEINALLVEKTKLGKTVVRLKGGDPFLFGRGAEEAAALAAAKLQFEIVPGVSSALAGPAYAGIPVTHRDYASQLTIFSGHEDPGKPDGGIDYAQLAKAPGTKVMLMGVERLRKIAAALMDAGASRTLPVAVIQWATTGRQRTIIGELQNIADRAEKAEVTSPAVTVFGEVVRLREELDWFEKRPLFGKRIVVTRTRSQAGGLSAALRELGADVFELPTIRIERPADYREFAELVQDAHQYDWIVFSSPNGVDAFFEVFFKLYNDAREIGGVRIAAMGPATAARVKAYHLAVDLQPEEFVAEGMIKALQGQTSIENERILIVRPEVTRDVLAPELSKLGGIVDEAIAYRTVPETEDSSGGIARFREQGADMITFTSSSTVDNFMALKLPIPAGMKVASIGPVTSATVKEHGLSVDVEATPHDVPTLLASIVKYYIGV